MTLTLQQRPRLSHAARLRFDARTGSYMLLSPERGLRLNASANEVLKRCTGEFTVREIVGELVDALAVRALQELAPMPPSDKVAAQVLEFLDALHERQLVVIEPLQ